MLSALVLLPVALGAIWLGGLFWGVLLAVAAALMAGEWLRLAGTAGPVPLVVLGGTTATAALLAAAGLPLAAFAVLAAGGVLLLPRGRGLPAAGVLAFGLPAVALGWLRADPLAGLGNVLVVVCVVWSSDIAAYAVGRLFGGPKLAPRVSPGKTWSGAVGGLLGAVLVGEAAVALDGGDAWRAGVLACVLGVVAQAGDLGESWLKRRRGVKDSGALIPGHGGVLDRLDALLAAAPAAAVLALAAGRGVHLWR